MKSNPIEHESARANGARIWYSAPTLRLVGDVRDLTAGGSMGNNEFLSGGTGKNCGNNQSRMC
jgi:hypothetical protein